MFFVLFYYFCSHYFYISYLLFIKLLHETDNTNKLIDKNYESVFSGELENLKWSILINLTGDELVDKTRESFTTTPDKATIPIRLKIEMS